MKDYAEKFYKSKTWQKTRTAYVSYRKGLCDRCLARGMYVPGEIVHHKVHITPQNITDPTVTLNFDNLELVCRNCHAELHSNKEGARFTLDREGKIIFDTPPVSKPQNGTQKTEGKALEKRLSLSKIE